MRYATQLYGGEGGSPFNFQGGTLRAINIRSAKLIDSIQLEFENGEISGYYGGNGGDAYRINLLSDEYIVTINGRSAAKVDSLTFVTNTGRVFGPYGGTGGDPFQVSNCKLKGIFGRSGTLIDAIGFNC